MGHCIVQISCFVKQKFVAFVNTVPLDRDDKTIKTDTFANLENIKSREGAYPSGALPERL